MIQTRRAQRTTGPPNRPGYSAKVRHGLRVRSATEKSPATLAAAPHQSAARLLDEVRPLDPHPIPASSYHISPKGENQTQHIDIS
jgi:hypothetical protein